MKKGFEGFEAVRAEKTEGGVKLFAWGRVYEFKNSFAPSDITVLGESILSEPIRLNAYFENGTLGTWTDFTYFIHEVTDERAVILVSAGCENVIGNATVTIEPDGFVKLDFRLMNYWLFSKGNNRARLTAFDMTASVKSEYSSLFHFWPNAKSSILPEGVFNAGATENAAFCFKPYAWTGNEKVGLGIFFGDSAEPFEVYDENKYIEVSKDGASTKIKLHMLDHMPFNWLEQGSDKWVETLETKFFTFGFQATPVKPMPSKREELNKITHILHTRLDVIDREGLYSDEIIEAAAKAGTKIFAFHEDWTAIQNYGYPYDAERFKRIVKKCHDLGMKVMVYFGYEYSSLAPDFSEKANEYLIKMPSGNFAGGWQRKPLQRDFMVCGGSAGYADVLIERVKYVMDELGVDHIYTDSTYIPHDCANTSHGCGYYDRNGQLQPTFTVLATRELVKKLYKTVHERGGIVDSHQSACCVMPVLAFCDSYVDGENIQHLVQKKQLRLDSFQCEYSGRNLVLPANFLAYTNDSFTMENMLAVPAIHNVITRVCSHKDFDYMSRVWKIYDEYALHDAPFVYYYDNTEVTTEQNAYVSLFKGSKTIAVMCNLEDGREETEICGSFKKATELMSGREYTFINGRARVETGTVKFRIFRLD